MLGSGGDGAVTSAATPRPGPPTAAEAIAASIDTGAAPPPAPANKTVRPMRKPASSAAAAAATPGRNHDASTSHLGTVARRSASPLRQLGQRGAQPIAQLTLHCCRIGPGPAANQRRIERLRTPHAAAATPVGRGVGDDPHQPWAERTPAIILGELHQG